MVITAKAPTIVVGGRTLGGANVMLPVEIQVGREKADAQPNANALSFSYIGNLPLEFVRGAPVNATLLGYEEPGWTDIWTDLWSVEPSDPGLLPTPDMEGYAQWELQNFDGQMEARPEDGGATLVTVWKQYGPTFDAIWKAPPFDLSGATDRVLRVTARVRATGQDSSFHWECLWSRSDPEPEYPYPPDGGILTGDRTELSDGSDVYCGWVFTLPDEAVYARLALRPGEPFTRPPWWDEVDPTLTWDDVNPTWTWDTPGTPTGGNLASWDEQPDDMTWDTAPDVAWDDWEG